jgi:curved DNA-binding protein CbpA
MNLQQLRHLVTSLEHRLETGSLYEVFNIQPTANEEAVRSAYRALARQLHADAWASQELGDLEMRMQRIMGELSKAQTKLTDPAQRGEYNAMLDLQSRGVPTDIRAIFDAESEFKNGLKALERNGTKSAHEAFKRAHELNPSEPEHLAYLRWTEYLIAGTSPAITKRTLDALLQLVDANPKRDSLCVLLGHVYRNDNSPVESLKWYKTAVRLNPDNFEARSGLRLLNSRKQKGNGNFFTRLFKR